MPTRLPALMPLPTCQRVVPLVPRCSTQMAVFGLSAVMFCPPGACKPIVRMFDTIAVVEPKMSGNNLPVNTTGHPRALQVFDLDSSPMIKQTGFGCASVEMVIRCGGGCTRWLTAQS